MVAIRVVFREQSECVHTTQELPDFFDSHERRRRISRLRKASQPGAEHDREDLAIAIVSIVSFTAGKKKVHLPGSVARDSIGSYTCRMDALMLRRRDGRLPLSA